MRWLLFGRKAKQKPKNDRDEGPVDKHTKELDNQLESAKQKLEQTRKEAVPDLAKAAASARRVQYRVDRFTDEIGRSFGRPRHG